MTGSLRAALLLSSAALLLCVATLGAADHTGKVTLTGVSIPGRRSRAKQGDKTLSTITDQDGVYRFTDIADGAWTLTVSMVGFEPMTREITLPSTAQGVWELALLPIEKIVGVLPDTQAGDGAGGNRGHRVAGTQPEDGDTGSHAAAGLSARRRQPGIHSPAGARERRTARRSDWSLPLAC